MTDTVTNGKPKPPRMVKHDGMWLIERVNADGGWTFVAGYANHDDAHRHWWRLLHPRGGGRNG
jgi:hypothetical protein